MNKVCVYAICKNELKFVDRWLESMKEADYVVVLDTGSTDGTYEKLKQDDRVTEVKQVVISPWRFDSARNESLKLVPEDANILICTDLDEVLTEGWADILRNEWIDGTHVRGYYKYAWAHNQNGDPENTFWYDKIHCKGYAWKWPVHEALYHPDYDSDYESEHCLRLDDRFFLHHFPDNSKSRGSYLGLLETRVAENPDDIYGRFYLAREYSFYEMYQESVNQFLQVLDNASDLVDSLLIAGCYCYLGDVYRKLHDNDKAIHYYLEAINCDITYREPYLYIGEILNEQKMYHAAILFVELALSKTRRHYNWLERGDTWREKPYDILGIAYYYLGDKASARKFMLKALEYNPTSDRLLYNLSFTN